MSNQHTFPLHNALLQHPQRYTINNQPILREKVPSNHFPTSVSTHFSNISAPTDGNDHHQAVHHRLRSPSVRTASKLSGRDNCSIIITTSVECVAYCFSSAVCHPAQALHRTGIRTDVHHRRNFEVQTPEEITTAVCTKYRDDDDDQPKFVAKNFRPVLENEIVRKPLALLERVRPNCI